VQKRQGTWAKEAGGLEADEAEDDGLADALDGSMKEGLASEPCGSNTQKIRRKRLL
jgi:hypothetical protein